MKSIVSNALAFQSCEAPNAAAPETKTQPADKSCASEGTGFADKLKDCENESAAKAKPPDQGEGEEKKDNGMCDNPNCMIYGIVGILEGFEPPVYQTDNAAVITAQGDQSCMQVLPQQEQNENVLMMVPSKKGDTALPGQIAGMLNTVEAGSGSAKTQEEIMQIVGEHLDSLENTSKQDNGVVPGGIKPEGQTAQVKPATAQPQEAESPELAAAAPQKAETESELVSPAPAQTEAYEQTGHGEKARNTESVRKSDAEDVKSLGAKRSPEHAGTLGQAAVAEAGKTPWQVAGDEAGKTLGQVAGAETAKPEGVRESVLRIVDKVSTKASEGQYDFDVDLKPDFLGKVSIKLTMRDGEVKVQIKADDIAVKGLLQDQAASLKDMLKEKGIPVSNIDVAYEGSAAPGSEGHAQHGEGRSPARNPFYEQSESGVFETAKEKYDLYFGNSNVEYLA